MYVRKKHNRSGTTSIVVVISEGKIAEDSKWDELKGYITNTDFDAERGIAEYHGLWVVERVFRISKGALEMRPMFYFTERRIEAHVCTCFIAYKVYINTIILIDICLLYKSTNPKTG